MWSTAVACSGSRCSSLVSLHWPDGADLARTQTDMDRDHWRSGGLEDEECAYGVGTPSRFPPRLEGDLPTSTLEVAPLHMGIGAQGCQRRSKTARYSPVQNCAFSSTA